MDWSDWNWIEGMRNGFRRDLNGHGLLDSHDILLRLLQEFSVDLDLERLHIYLLVGIEEVFWWCQNNVDWCWVLLFQVMTTVAYNLSLTRVWIHLIGLVLDGFITFGLRIVVLSKIKLAVEEIAVEQVIYVVLSQFLIIRSRGHSLQNLCWIGIFNLEHIMILLVVVILVYCVLQLLHLRRRHHLLSKTLIQSLGGHELKVSLACLLKLNILEDFICVPVTCLRLFLIIRPIIKHLFIGQNRLCLLH